MSRRIATVNVRISDRVVSGDVLATLVATDLEFGLRQAEATLALAVLQRDEAVTERNRVLQLGESGAASSATVDRVEGAAGMAEASVDLARVRVDVAKKRLADTRVRAPFAGVVVARNLEPGELFVGPSGAPPLRLVDLERVRVVASIGEAHAPLVQPDQPVSVVVSALPLRVFQGTVERVNRTVDPRTRTVEIHVALDNPEGLLWHGMAAEITVEGVGMPGKSSGWQHQSMYHLGG